ncbi:MAG: hypothetical protein JNK17_02140 [Hydrogenophaga sp.]|nr:hypothetical protein [Hydrogenophaga sp.]
MITTLIPLLSTPVADDLDTANFPARARANFLEVNPILSAINQMIVELNAESDSINSQSSGAAAARTAAEAAAAAAAVSASAAAATSTAANWVSGTTYAIGNVRRSLIDGMPYRRLTAGAGTIDPRDDATNWALDYLQYDTSLPTIRPSLLLDFANSGVVDPRITVTRASTATYWDANGVLKTAAANTLRITHAPVTGERLGALGEGLATNRALYSGDISNANWAKVRVNVVSGVVAPDGIGVMARIAPTSENQNHYVAMVAAGVGAGSKLVVSVFARSAGMGRFKLLTQSGVVWPEAIFDVNSGVVAYQNGCIADIELVAPGTYRCWAAVDSTDANATLHIMPVANDNSQVFVGDGVLGVDVWGAQMETGVSTPTSYIPTTSAAASRSADDIVISGASFTSFYKQGEGTFVQDLIFLPTDGGSTGNTGKDLFSYETAGTNSRLTAFFFQKKIGLYLGAAGGAQLLNFATADCLSVGLNRVCISVKAGSAVIAVNGKTTAIVTGGPAVPAADRVKFITAPNRPIPRHKYYPFAVSTSEAIALSRI